jgi:sigma-B regulation protein RsbU (phosphoserine phosphatase)
MKTAWTGLRGYWRRVSRLDAAAFLCVVLGAMLLLAGRFLRPGGPAGFFKFLAVLAAFYLLVRLIGWWRGRLLWSLRNRLVVAYLFIAVVPVLLLLMLAVLAGQILYSQLGAYLLYEDVQGRVALLADGAENVAAADAALPASVPDAVRARVLEGQARVRGGRELPGLEIKLHGDAGMLQRLGGAGAQTFAGIVQSGNQIRLVALRQATSARGTQVVELSVAVTPELLESVAPDLGPIQVTVAQRVEGAGARDAVRIGEAEYRAVGRIVTRRRALQKAGFAIDPDIEGFSKLDATYLENGEGVERGHPVFAFFTARPSQLNRRIFSSLGDLSRGKVMYFQIAAVAFLLIELAALITGIVLTRAITSTVADLYRGTQHVQAGDLTHRVRIARRDQLGVLGESFNQMTGSISSLIEEQRQRQRLENEISIAREVQAQLFPQKLPEVPGVELGAICRAARVVSGDYYDFIQLNSTHLLFAVADISGKGISAALLMASLQAALRSQVLVPGSERLSTAELVSRLNRHLVRNTADDRFATLFLAVYDSASHMLRYTNAGHLPPLCLAKGSARSLGVGGMVLGVLEEYEYEEGSLVVAPGTLLIGYSDGLVEPENVYGEQFGIRRLEEAAQRRYGAPVHEVAEALMSAADEWAGTPEQADDMTVVVARLG